VSETAPQRNQSMTEGRKSRLVNPFTITAATIALVIILYVMQVSFLDLMDLKTLDLRFVSRGGLTPGPEVVLAVVDEKSLYEQGKWVWPRTKFADLIRKLSEGGAKVIGLDIGFLEPDRTSTQDAVEEVERAVSDFKIDNAAFRIHLQSLKMKGDHDAILADAIGTSKAKVVLGYFFQMDPSETGHLDATRVATHIENVRQGRYQWVRFRSEAAKNVPLLDAYMPQSNIPVISEAGRSTGFFNMVPDPDGTVRWMNMVVRCRGELYAPLSLQVLSAYKDANIAVEVGDYGIERLRLGNVRVPTDEAGRLMINYRGREKTFPHISATDILEGRLAPDQVRDKIVLVGATAVGIYDIRVTPFSSVFPGLEIHANVVDNILRGDFLSRPNWADVFDLMAMIVIGALLGFVLPRVRVLWGIGALASIFILYLLLCEYLFAHKGAVLSIVYPSLVLVLTYMNITVYRYVTEERQKRFIRGAFSTYLAPSVVAEIIKSPEKLALGGEDRVITAFFSDVQGFTSISEKLSAPELVVLLNEFLTEMTDIILANKGTLDKFEGDAIIAFFGAPIVMPDHAARACRACVQMQKRLVELRTKWKEENRPLLRMRIGMNTGKAVVGNMGSKARMDYTMMGDTVNTAARLEGVNKIYGTYTMISEQTYVQTADAVVVRELDAVNVVGKGEPVRVYEVVGFPEDVREETRELLDHYSRGLAAYRQRGWDEATNHFKEALSIRPDDGPSITMTRRCEQYRLDPPPEGWNGSFTMTSK